GQRGGAPDGPRRVRRRRPPPPRDRERHDDAAPGGVPPCPPGAHDDGGGHGGGGGPGVGAMPVFEYEVADRAGALSRGRAQAENAGDLIVRFREQGRLVVAIRPAAADGALGAASSLALGGSLRTTLLRLSSGVGL